jgi:hypothetical protein
LARFFSVRLLRQRLRGRAGSWHSSTPSVPAGHAIGATLHVSTKGPQFRIVSGDSSLDYGAKLFREHADWLLRAPTLPIASASPPRSQSLRRFRSPTPVAAGWGPALRCLQSCPDLPPSVAPCSPPSRTLRATSRWPGGALTATARDILALNRPGRRNGTQPNRETSIAGSARLFPPMPISEQAGYFHGMLGDRDCIIRILVRVSDGRLSVS